MDAIKKKMQAMKLEKEAALDKADQLEQALNEQKEKNEKVRAQLRFNTSLQTQNPLHFNQILQVQYNFEAIGFKFPAVRGQSRCDFGRGRSMYIHLYPPSWIQTERTIHGARPLVVSTD